MTFVLSVEVLGGYPRSDRYRRLRRRLEEKAEETTWRVGQVLVEDTMMIIGIQLGSGMTAVVDGMMDWHDPLRPFAEAWLNTGLGELARWFDNNFFYRKPVFTDLPSPKYYVWPPRVRHVIEALPEGVGLKIVVPGPLTFAKLSHNKTGKSEWELAEAIAEILSAEARLSVEAGASIIQIDEPYLADVDVSVDDAVHAVNLINKIVKGLNASSRIAIPYNVPVPEVYEAILEAKVDYIVIDLADNPAKALSLLKNKGLGGHGLGLGIVQARDIYPDPYEKIRDVAREAYASTGKPEKVLLTTSAWLDLIPFRYAIDKTRLLGMYAAKLVEESLD